MSAKYAISLRSKDIRNRQSVPVPRFVANRAFRLWYYKFHIKIMSNKKVTACQIAKPLDSKVAINS